MKYRSILLHHQVNQVAPLVGAWIEIVSLWKRSRWYSVAPLVGAWIEIWRHAADTEYASVAPLVGAWIEISETIAYASFKTSLLL